MRQIPAVLHQRSQLQRLLTIYYIIASKREAIKIQTIYMKVTKDVSKIILKKMLKYIASLPVLNSWKKHSAPF